MQTRTFLIVSLLLISFLLTAQNVGKNIIRNQIVPDQKIYIHTDREFYFYGDTLWFAAYLVDGNSHKLTQESCNLYVDIVDSNGVISQNEIFPIENGFAPGYLSFSDHSFNEGNYLLRAYTDYLKNFGDDCFFEKPIRLSETKNFAKLTGKSNTETDSTKIDLQFFPEGGFLLANQKNRVAFKAINENGKPVDVSGEITDDKGRSVCSFNSTYKGMGSFHFTPSARKKYNITIEGQQGSDTTFPEVRSKESKIIVSKVDKDVLWFQILSDEKKIKSPFIVAILHRGEEQFVLEINESQLNRNIQVKTDSLNGGINRIVLLNSELEPLSERLVFVDSDNKIDLDLELNQTQFETREKVALQINSTSIQENESANISIAVVDENALNSGGITQNIESYLLIDSELKGPIPSPADFFIDTDTISSQAKLDLLMLTNGWKNYTWNTLVQNQNPISNQPSLGIKLSGKVLKQNGKKTLDGGELVLSVKSKNAADVYSEAPDKQGNFVFENVQFYDTTTIFLQGKNHKSKNKTWLQLDSFDYTFPANLHKTNQLKSFSDIPLSLYRLNYFNTSTLKEFYPDYDTRLIKEIEVKAEKPEEPDGHPRIYEKPNASFEIKETDTSFPNVWAFIGNRVPGVRVLRINGGYKITIGGPNGADPVFLLNGLQTTQGDIGILNMATIDKVDILKRNEAAIYGARGSGGIISVWTKRAEFRDPSTIPIPPGTIVKTIKGFAPYCEFYSPKYTSENIDSKTPDVRTTLFWNANVTMKEGNAELSFFTCDNVSRYVIFVEGITNNGKVCTGNAKFVVNQKRNTTAKH